MELIKTKDPKFTLRFAEPKDAAVVLEYSRKLGTYQKMRDKITATEEDFVRLISEKHGEAILGEYDGKTVAYAYIYNDSSAFSGKTSMYIDMFYVDEEMRGKGLGKILLAFVSN